MHTSIFSKFFRPSRPSIVYMGPELPQQSIVSNSLCLCYTFTVE